jgi:hypothetical protein
LLTGRLRSDGRDNNRFSILCRATDAERCFEFLLRIDEDPLGIKRLPDKFTEFVNGVELA